MDTDLTWPLRVLVKDYGNKAQNEKSAALNTNPKELCQYLSQEADACETLSVMLLKYKREMWLNWSTPYKTQAPADEPHKEQHFLTPNWFIHSPAATQQHLWCQNTDFHFSIILQQISDVAVDYVQPVALTKHEAIIIPRARIRTGTVGSVQQNSSHWKNQ